MGRNSKPAAVLPPHNLTLEENVLGSVFYKPALLDELSTILLPTDFYQPGHRLIYQAMLDIWDKGEALPDVVTVQALLARRGQLDQVGGSQNIGRVASECGIGNGEGYARQVADYARLRATWEAGHRIVELTQQADDDARTTLDRAEAELFKLRERDVGTGGGVQDAREAIHAFLDQVDARVEAGGVIETPMGWPDLDKKFGGLKKGTLYLLAARPGLGKSGAACEIALNVAKQGKRVLFSSLEMSASELLARMVGSEANVVYQKIDDGTIDGGERERVEFHGGKVGMLPISFYDDPIQSLYDIKAKARQIKRDEDLELILVDYLQLIQPTPNGGSQNRQQDVSTIVRGLKVLARELDVPIVALSQLNRNLEITKRKPVLADLRESGELEQAANVILFLHRAQDMDGNVLNPFETEVIVAKNRGGQVGSAFLHVSLPTNRWRSMERR